MERRFTWPAIALTCLLVPLPALSDGPSFRISDITPAGSWVEREQRTVDHKNRETVATMRQTMLGKEPCGDETCYRVESVTNTYKIKKNGEMKQQGEQAIVQTLIAESVFNADPANAMNNLSGFGKEIIFQTGEGQPMRIEEGGTLAGFMMQALGVKADYTFTSAGKESVETPAGTFRAEKFNGTGSVDTRILIQKISIRSESEFWMSPDVPFGFAKMVSKDLVNNKPQSTEAYVKNFELSGGETLITGEPVDFMGGGDQPAGEQESKPKFKFKDLIPGN